MDDVSAQAHEGSDGSEGSEGSGGSAGDVVVLAQHGHTLVLLYGDIDVRCTDDLEHAGRFSIDAARLTIMDVRRVTMIDSVGLSFVIRLAAGLRSNGTELVLRGPSPRVAELITLVGADELVRWTTP
jgi:anti-anti-sigma factor